MPQASAGHTRQPLVAPALDGEGRANTGLTQPPTLPVPGPIASRAPRALAN